MLLMTKNGLVAALFLLLAGTGAAMAQDDCDTAGLALADGFCATVFADDLGPVRHMAISADGDVYVALRKSVDGHSIVALRDTDGDGRADVVRFFGEAGGTGIAIHHGYLYFGTVTQVLRWPLHDKTLVPEGPSQVVVAGLPVQRQHAARSLVITPQGELFINIGAPSNSCQKQDRKPNSPGIDPCPMLRLHGGIWRFSATATGQQFDAAHRYATGIRNAVAMDWNARQAQLYVMQHGRDALHRLWPQLYTQKQSAILPAEQFFRVDEGDNFGWPYCYYDARKHRKVLAPEYGGDGDTVGRCSQFENPIMAFPAHWAPNGLLFYYGDAFPDSYTGGAFIAFHGSWNRAPFPQQGYKVVFVPMADGLADDDQWQVFADGFAGKEPLSPAADAEYRPMGLAVGPEGALYISDDHHGRVWRITYHGE